MKIARYTMLSALVAAVVALAVPALAVDLNDMQKKGEAIKGQAETIKKDGGQVKSDVQEMKAKEVIKGSGQVKDDSSKMKDIVTGK